MLRADISASVFDDEEKCARAAMQVHEVARDRYRSDAGGSAYWAGCDRTTTLVAGARHVETFIVAARNMPTEPRRFAPSCGPSGRLHAPKSWEAMSLVSLADLGNGPTIRHRNPGDVALVRVSVPLRALCGTTFTPRAEPRPLIAVCAAERPHRGQPPDRLLQEPQVRASQRGPKPDSAGSAGETALSKRLRGPLLLDGLGGTTGFRLSPLLQLLRLTALTAACGRPSLTRRHSIRGADRRLRLQVPRRSRSCGWCR